MSDVLTEYRIHSQQISNAYELERKAASLILRSALILNTSPKIVRSDQIQLFSPLFTKIRTEVEALGTEASSLWKLDYTDFVWNSFCVSFFKNSGHRFDFVKHFPILIKSFVFKIMNEPKRNSYIDSVLNAASNDKKQMGVHSRDS
jgi:hypothetical protein